jgi:hypothetical protein
MEGASIVKDFVARGYFHDSGRRGSDDRTIWAFTPAARPVRPWRPTGGRWVPRVRPAGLCRKSWTSLRNPRPRSTTVNMTKAFLINPEQWTIKPFEPSADVCRTLTASLRARPVRQRSGQAGRGQRGRGSGLALRSRPPHPAGRGGDRCSPREASAGIVPAASPRCSPARRAPLRGLRAALKIPLREGFPVWEVVAPRTSGASSP